MTGSAGEWRGAAKRLLVTDITMRTTKLFAAVLVAGLIGSACQQNPDYVLPAINVASEEIVFSTDLDYILELTSTREWRVRNKPDWVTVEPDRGGASDVAQRTRISVPVNPEYNRSGHVVFSIGLAKATVAVSQSGAKGDIPVGSGTLEDPYTVTGVIRYVESLGSDVESPQEVYIKGTIDEVTEEYTARYGNGSFKMRNESGEEVFYVYRTKFLENKNWVEGDTQIQRGDEVVVYGTVVNFRGNTPETAQGKSYLYSLNGETQGSGGGGETITPQGDGSQAAPYNVVAAVEAVKNLTWTSNSEYQSTDPVYVKGKISKIANKGSYGESGFGNATFYISDDGKTGGTEFYCYRIKYLGNVEYTSGTDIKVGDDVVIYGKLMNYKGNTPETVSNAASLYSLNGKTE